jgi:hypothetical protein
MTEYSLRYFAQALMTGRTTIASSTKSTARSILSGTPTRGVLPWLSVVTGGWLEWRFTDALKLGRRRSEATSDEAEWKRSEDVDYDAVTDARKERLRRTGNVEVPIPFADSSALFPGAEGVRRSDPPRVGNPRGRPVRFFHVHIGRIRC